MKRAAKPAKKPTKPASKRSAKPAKKATKKPKPAKKRATKPAKSVAKKRATKPAAKRAPKATAAPVQDQSASESTASTAAPSGAALTPIEIEARELLDADKNGDIDNVFDIVEDLEAIRKGLPKTSELYPEWKRFYDDCCRIMGESVGM